MWINDNEGFVHLNSSPHKKRVNELCNKFCVSLDIYIFLAAQEIKSPKIPYFCRTILQAISFRPTVSEWSEVVKLPVLGLNRFVLDLLVNVR